MPIRSNLCLSKLLYCTIINVNKKGIKYLEYCENKRKNRFLFIKPVLRNISVKNINRNNKLEVSLFVKLKEFVLIIA